MTEGGRSLAGSGTDETTWLRSTALRALPTLPPTAVRGAGRLVVVAPHPDDEVLGVGGLLAASVADGTPVLVVAVTEGEGSHPGSPTLGARALADRRHDERLAALAALGMSGDPPLHRLGLPDGGVTADGVASGLRPRLGPDDLCVAPVEFDGHPDHEATGVGARRAASAAGCRLWSYPIWYWHWAHPGRDGRALSGAARVVLDDHARRAKARAIDAFTSQIAPLSDDPRDAAVLPASVLARFSRPFEVIWP